MQPQLGFSCIALSFIAWEYSPLDIRPDLTPDTERSVAASAHPAQLPVYRVRTFP